MVTNTSTLTQTMTLVVEADSTPVLQQPLTLDPGESYAYTTSTLATIPLTLTASASNALVQATPLVAYPEVTAELLAPEVAGRDPFSVTLVVSNTGMVPAVVQTTVAGQAGPELDLQPGEVVAAQATAQISADTELTATVRRRRVAGSCRYRSARSTGRAVAGGPGCRAGRIGRRALHLDAIGSLLTTGRFELEVDGMPAAAAEFAVPAGSSRRAQWRWRSVPVFTP